MARKALQLSIISAQHFWTRRAASRNGFSSRAAVEFSILVRPQDGNIVHVSNHTYDTEPITGKISFDLLSNLHGSLTRTICPNPLSFHGRNLIFQVHRGLC